MSLITTPNSGNTYYFRSRIPADLIEHFGGLTEFRVSLKCAIKSRALRTTKKLERTVSKLYEKIREGMKVDHKNKMFQIMIKILVCMYILIFYSNNVFSKTNKNILNKTNFQIQAIIISNLGSGLGLSYKLNNNLWFSLEQQTEKGTMSRNTNGNSNREDSDFDTRTVYANLRYYLTDILDKLSFQTGLIYRDWEAKSLIIDNGNEQRKGVYRVKYPENGYNFGLGLNWFYTNGLFSSLNFVKIITNEPSVEYELEGDYECNLSCQEDFEAKVDKYSPTNLLFLNIGFSF